MAAEQTIHLERYSPEAKALVASAQSLADDRKHAQVEPIHLLARAVEQGRGAREVFRRAGAEPAELSAEIESALRRIRPTAAGLSYLSSPMLTLLARAESEAGTETVEIEDLLNALSQEIRGPAAVALQAFGLGPGSLRAHVSALKGGPREGAPATADNGGDAISRYTHDLVDRARKGGFDPVVGRDVEVRRLLQILERRHKNCPLLIGEPGTGKTAIVGALAMRLAAGDAPESLTKLDLLELETGLLVAGAKLRGEIEERLRQLFTALKSAPRETLLYVGDIDSLFGQGAVGSGVGDLLKPVLARGEVRLLASTTVDGARKLADRDPALFRKFSPLTIEASSLAETLEILRAIASKYEVHHKVQIGEGAMVAAAKLAKRYLQDRALPDAAIDLLDETAARKRVETDGIPAALEAPIQRLASLRAQLGSLAGDSDVLSVKTRERIEAEARELEPDVAQTRAQIELRRHAESVDLPLVTEEDVALVLGEWTGIPVRKMLESESEKLLKMETRLAERVVGQDEAVRAVSRAVRRGRVGLRDPGKPIGSFLFLGPSGVARPSSRRPSPSFSSTT